MKRTTPNEMFGIVRAFIVARRDPLKGAESVSHSFFAIRHYNALLRANPKAVRKFFSYMSRSSSWKLTIQEILIRGACRSRLIRGLASKAGYISGVYNSANYSGVRWGEVDALVAEWQFVACFISSHNIVIHCVSDSKYHPYFHNEIEARKAMAGIVYAPELFCVYDTWPAGWIERIVTGSGNVGHDSRYFAGVQGDLLRLYERTRNDITLANYLNRLRALVRQRYPDGTRARTRIETLVASVEDHVSVKSDEVIWLSRCHGDLYPGQVIVEDGRPYVIDWCGSEEVSVFHDLIFSAIFHYGWREYAKPIQAPALQPLLSGLCGVLRSYSPEVVVGIVLAEIGTKEYVDYLQKRGRYATWIKVVEDYLNSTVFDQLTSGR